MFWLPGFCCKSPLCIRAPPFPLWSSPSELSERLPPELKPSGSSLNKIQFSALRLCIFLSWYSHARTIKMSDKFWPHRCNPMPVFVYRHFHGFVYYLCADDSNLLSSWPEYPTANTVFPLCYLSDARSSASPETLSPWSSAWNLFLLQCFLSPGIEQPTIHTGKSEIHSWCSFPFLFLSMVVQQLVVILMFSWEEVSSSPSTPPSCLQP